MARKLSKKNAEYLHALARSGDRMAIAVLELASDVSLTKGTLAAGVYPVTGQMVDGAGNLVLGVSDFQVEINTVSAATIHATTGTTKLGDNTEQVWLQTNAQGQFVLNVSNPTPGELSLLIVQTPDGVLSITELQF